MIEFINGLCTLAGVMALLAGLGTLFTLPCSDLPCLGFILGIMAMIGLGNLMGNN